jgi:hypothetical protein
VRNDNWSFETAVLAVAASGPHVWSFGIQIQTAGLVQVSARPPVGVCGVARWRALLVWAEVGMMGCLAGCGCGCGQVGWCNEAARFLPEDGCGVGDDWHSYAFDTLRNQLWHGDASRTGVEEDGQPLVYGCVCGPGVPQARATAVPLQSPRLGRCNAPWAW